MLQCSHKHINNIMYHFPIFKEISDNMSPSSYHPIFLLSPKTSQESFLLYILIPATYSFFNPLQSDFCPHPFTETALDKVISDLHIANSVVNPQLSHSKYQQHLEALNLFAWLSRGSSSWVSHLNGRFIS